MARTPRCLSTLSGMESGCLTRVISMRRRTLEICTDCCNSSKLLPSRGLTCSSSSRSMRCHSPCHVRRLARRRLTSNDGSSGVVVIIDLSLPMQEAENRLSFCIGSLVWDLFCGLFWLRHGLRMHTQKQAIHCWGKRWHHWKAGRLKTFAPFLMGRHPSELSMLGVLVLHN